MNRTKFYNKVTVNSIQELDFLDNNLSKFSMKNIPQYIRTGVNDIQRPDLLSYKSYFSVKFWWLILLVNNVKNPLEDIEEGVKYVLPNVLDIYSFYRKYSLR